jgi:hypothetical protein
MYRRVLKGGTMKCPKCKEEIRSGVSFCGKCGKKLSEKQLKENNKSGIINKLKAIFAFFIVYPAISIIRFFTINQTADKPIDADVTNKASIIAVVFIGYFIYFLIAERKKLGLNMQLFIVSLLYVASMGAGGFLDKFVAPLTFNIAEVLFFTYAIIYLNSKEYSDYLSKMPADDFKKIYWIKKEAQQKDLLNQMALWALIFIPVVMLIMSYLLQRKSSLSIITFFVLILLTLFFVVMAMALRNMFSSFQQLAKKKKGKK